MCRCLLFLVLEVRKLLRKCTVIGKEDGFKKGMICKPLPKLTHISLTSFYGTWTNRIAPDGANRGVPSGAILFICGVPSGVILFAYTIFIEK